MRFHVETRSSKCVRAAHGVRVRRRRQRRQRQRRPSPRPPPRPSPPPRRPSPPSRRAALARPRCAADNARAHALFLAPSLPRLHPTIAKRRCLCRANRARRRRYLERAATRRSSSPWRRRRRRRALCRRSSRPVRAALASPRCGRRTTGPLAQGANQGAPDQGAQPQEPRGCLALPIVIGIPGRGERKRIKEGWRGVRHHRRAVAHCCPPRFADVRQRRRRGGGGRRQPRGHRGAAAFLRLRRRAGGGRRLPVLRRHVCDADARGEGGGRGAHHGVRHVGMLREVLRPNPNFNRDVHHGVRHVGVLRGWRTDL